MSTPVATSNNFQTITVGSHYPATQLVYAEGITVQLLNLDPNNTVYLGGDNAIEAGDTNHTIPLAPGGSYIAGGNVPIFGITLAGQSAAIARAPDAVNFTIPPSLSGLGGAKLFNQSTAPTQPPLIPVNSIWYNNTPGNQSLNQWNGTTWVQLAVPGTNLIEAGTVIANLIAAGTIVAGIVNGTEIDGSIFRATNAFGATIMTINKAAATWLLYADTGSATQGALILSGASSAGTDEFGFPFIQGFGAYAVSLTSEIGIGINPANNNLGINFQSSGLSPAFASPSVSANANTSAGTSLNLNSGLGIIRPTDNDANISVTSQLESGVVNGQIILQAGQIQLGGSGEAVWDENAGQLSIQAGHGPFIPGEGFHTITLPGTGGFSGTIRVKKLPWNMILLDVAIQWTNTTNASFTGGSLPDASYYPTSARWFPLAHGGTQTGDNNAVIEIPTSGGIVITTNLSSGGSGTAAQAGITVTYPTN